MWARPPGANRVTLTGSAAMPEAMHRRAFLGQTGMALGALALGGSGVLGAAGKGAPRPPVYVFSKHLQFLDYADLGPGAAALGFDGIDLTVRPGGHVEPHRVRKDLPRAVKAIRDAGMEVKTISTAVLDNEEGHDRAVLETAAACGIEQYRIGPALYRPADEPEAHLETWLSNLRRLESLNREFGILGAVQNHSRFYVGGLIWDLWMGLRDTEASLVGCHYDICHAVAEAAVSWPVGFHLLKGRIRALVVKDFVFKHSANGNNRSFVPLGTGMVPWRQFWSLVAEAGLHVPLILHMEYADEAPPDVIRKALKTDLQTLHGMLAGTWKE